MKGLFVLKINKTSKQICSKIVQRKGRRRVNNDFYTHSPQP